MGRIIRRRVNICQGKKSSTSPIFETSVTSKEKECGKSVVEVFRTLGIEVLYRSWTGEETETEMEGSDSW